MDRERDRVRKRMEGQRQGRPSSEVERVAPEWRERSVRDAPVHGPATEIPATPVTPPAPPLLTRIVRKIRPSLHARQIVHPHTLNPNRCMQSSIPYVKPKDWCISRTIRDFYRMENVQADTRMRRLLSLEDGQQ